MSRPNPMGSIFITALCFAILVNVVHAQPNEANTNSKRSLKAGYTFSYTPLYQFKTDIDDGGEFDVQRHFLRFGVTRAIDRNWMTGIGLSFDYERWNFSEIAELGGVDLWNDVFRPGISIPVFYRGGNNWRWGLISSINFSGASGADIGESISYGAVISAAYSFGSNLTLGLGAGLFERLDQFEAFPYVVVNWKITDQLRLGNPFQAGPVGPAGIELVYKPLDALEIGLGGAYRSFRFRLDDNSAVADGIGQVDSWTPFLRMGYQAGRHLQVDIAGGAMLNGSITIEDRDANELGKRDFDTAPFIGVTLKGRF